MTFLNDYAFRNVKIVSHGVAQKLKSHAQGHHDKHSWITQRLVLRKIEPTTRHVQWVQRDERNQRH